MQIEVLPTESVAERHSSYATLVTFALIVVRSIRNWERKAGERRSAIVSFLYPFEILIFLCLLLFPSKSPSAVYETER